MSVCLSVCLFVCLFTFDVPFKRLFAPTSQSRMSNILEIQNPWGKVMERSGLRLEHFYLEAVLNCQTFPAYLSLFQPPYSSIQGHIITLTTAYPGINTGPAGD